MKKVLASLFVTYALTLGQAPPVAVNPIASATTTTPASVQTTTTTASAVSSTAAQTTTTAAASTTTTAALGTTTGAPATTTTAAPVSTTTTAAPETTTTAAPETTTTTSVPTYYVNPYCPAGEVFSKLGSAPGAAALATHSQAECRSNVPDNPQSRAIDYMGELICADWACCLCQEINCGASGYPCRNIKIGSSGAIGVQHIVVSGLSNSLFAGNMDGAQLYCAGLEACKFANIYGHHIKQLACAGDNACEAAMIQIEPADQMSVQCNGNRACADSVIEIVVTGNSQLSEIHGIAFNGADAASGATLVIRNLAAQPLYIDSLECLSQTACLNLKFVIEGNVVISHCQLLGVSGLQTLPTQLQACVSGGGVFVAPGYNPYLPPYTPYYLPTTTTTTTTQQPVVVSTLTPPAAVSTSTQTPASSLPVIVGDPAALICIGTECAGRTFDITPAQGWKLECKMNCQGMTVNLNVGGDPLNSNRPTEFLSDIKFLGVNSGAGVTININNVFGVYGAFVELNDVRCQEFGSCAGLKIVAGTGIDIWSTSFDCQVAGACQGCEVTQNGVTQSCEVLSNGQYAYNQNVPQYQYNPYIPVWV